MCSVKRRATWITADPNPQLPQLDVWDMPRGDEYLAAIRITGEPAPVAPAPEGDFRAAGIIISIGLSGCALALTGALIAALLGWRS